MTHRSSPPNLIVIMADSLAPHFTGPYGDQAGATPNLSLLAKSGVVFERAYCNAPLCAPSRASLVTGRYAGDISAYDNANEFSSEWPTIGHTLARQGYESTIIGKMHFQGHDQWHGFKRLAIECDYSSSYSPDQLRMAYDWQQPSQGNPMGGNWMGASYVQSPQWQDYRHHFDRDETIHRAACSYLEAKAGTSQPFFAFLSYHAPHNPFWIAESDRQRFVGKEASFPRPLSDLETCHGPMDRWINDFHYVADIRDRLLTPDNLRWLYSTFYGMTFDWDRRLGQLLEILKRTDRLQDTAIMVIADHGDMLGQRGMIQKRSFYEHSLRVPWICSFPGRWRHGSRISAPVSLVDLLPTLAAIAGAAAPDGLPGVSLLPALTDGSEPGERTIFAEYHGEGVHAPCYAALRGGFKYIYVHGHEERLYDVPNDPYELRNLAGDERHAGTMRQLRDELLGRFDPQWTSADATRRQGSRSFIYRSFADQRARAAAR